MSPLRVLALVARHLLDQQLELFEGESDLTAEIVLDDGFVPRESHRGAAGPMVTHQRDRLLDYGLLAHLTSLLASRFSVILVAGPLS